MFYWNGRLISLLLYKQPIITTKSIVKITHITPLDDVGFGILLQKQIHNYMFTVCCVNLQFICLTDSASLQQSIELNCLTGKSLTAIIIFKYKIYIDIVMSNL